mgnify:FL=1
MADVTILFGGYNSITQTYNSGGYNQDVAFTGLSSGLGSVTVVVPGDVPVTGVEGTSAVGSVTVDIGTAVGIEVTGVAATGSAGVINIWGPIDPSQTPNWAAISTSQTPNWTEIAA